MWAISSFSTIFSSCAYLFREQGAMIFSKHFGFETTFVCYREKHVGLHSGSWGDALYPPRNHTMRWKITIDGQKLYGEKTVFSISVTPTKSIKYFWNCFGWAKGLSDTQNGCEMLKKTKISFSPPFWVPASPLVWPKQFQKYSMVLVSVTQDRKLCFLPI